MYFLNNASLKLNMNNTLQLVNVSKKYYNKTALSNINLTFTSGNIFGLLGPNGSGKTTLMKLIAGLHKQTEGSIIINGEPLSYKAKEFVAYMPTENFLYDNFTVEKIIRYFNDMYNDFDIQRAIKLIDDFKIDKKSNIKSLSSGLVAKVKLAITLARNAYIYMFDEPLNGIDLITREEIVNNILNASGNEKIIIVSSHLVEEIEKLFDEVIFINNTEVALSGNAEQLRTQYGKSIENIYKEVYR